MEDFRNQPARNLSFYERNRYLIKGLFVGMLILVMMVPATFIRQLVFERESRHEAVTTEVSSKWADSQTVAGPILMVPYTVRATGSDGKETVTIHQAFFLPDNLTVNGQIEPEIRKRSLYEVALYRNNLELSGSFKSLSIASLGLQSSDMLWQQAKVLVVSLMCAGLKKM